MPVSLRFFQASFAAYALVPAASGTTDHKHYLGLDFLRGVAAIAVVWYHCSTRFELPYLFPHGYLAVDFFFALSGFVIARAYQVRISSRRLPMLQFALLRAVRLLPLIVLGTLLAALGEFARPGVADQRQHLIDAMWALLFGSILIPTLYPTSLTFTVFPLNGPTWSLFLEAVANGIFAVWAQAQIRLVSLVPMLVFSAIFVLFGAYLTGKVDFGAVRDDFWLGFARVGWSFFLGVILFHFRDKAPQIPFIVPASVLIAVLLTPSLAELNIAFDAICVLLVLPWIVWVASSAQLGATAQRWSTLSGDLSYPIYALHYPLIRFFGGGGLILQLSLIGRLGVAVIATFVVIIVSAAAYIIFDAPARKWLSAKLVRFSVATNKSRSENI